MYFHNETIFKKQFFLLQLDAFNTPNLKKSNENVTKVLMDTKVQLESARLNCTTLENQLAEKDEYYTNREQEIQEHYKSEIKKGKNVHHN